MRGSLFFTTLTNHRPISLPVTARASAREESAPAQEPAPAPRQFHATTARDPETSSTALRNMLGRSTQPVFSVSAMFGVRAGGSCKSCGH